MCFDNVSFFVHCRHSFYSMLRSVSSRFKFIFSPTLLCLISTKQIMSTPRILRSRQSNNCVLDEYCPSPGTAFCVEAPTFEKFVTEEIYHQVEVPESAKQPFVVSIEGNIGCGKTTFIDYFAEWNQMMKETNPNMPDQVELVSEPLDMWCNLDGKYNLLEKLYSNTTEFCYTFNLYAFMTRMAMHNLIPNQPRVKMLERSLYSTRFVFAENSYRQGHLTKMEYDMLHEWFDYIQHSENVHVDLFVYLRASPEFCYQRIKSRNRSEESTVPYEFIEGLHQIHEEWLLHKTAGKLNAPVLILDASLGKEAMRDTFHQYKDDILYNFNRKHLSPTK